MLMRFRPLLLLLFQLGVLAACQNDDNRFHLDGEISGLTQTEFYIYNDEGLLPGIDTVRVLDGRFKYERELPGPMVLTLLYPNYSRTHFVAEPGRKLKLRGESSKLKSVDISGSEENELLSKFRIENAGKPAKELSMAAAQFIRDYPARLSAWAVFKSYFGQMKNRDAVLMQPLLDTLRAAQPDNRAIEEMDGMLRSQLGTAVGSRLPDFEAVTLKGDTIRRSDFEGKPLLVVFWAPWSSESFNLVKRIAYYESHYINRLQILTVSIDYEKRTTEVRLKQQVLRSPSVCEERGFSSPLARTLGVRYVSGNLLVDEKGIIIKRDVPMDALDRTLADWLDKK